MDLKKIIKNLVLDFPVIYGLSMIATLIWSACSSPEARYGLNFFWEMLLFSLGADLPIFVFYSRKELSSKQFILRLAIHAALLEAILLPAGYFIGLWGGVGGFFAFFMTILAVDAAVIGLTYLSDKKTIKEVNDAIKERKRGVDEDDND